MPVAFDDLSDVKGLMQHPFLIYSAGLNRCDVWGNSSGWHNCIHNFGVWQYDVTYFVHP